MTDRQQAIHPSLAQLNSVAVEAEQTPFASAQPLLMALSVAEVPALIEFESFGALFITDGFTSNGAWQTPHI